MVEKVLNSEKTFLTSHTVAMAADAAKAISPNQEERTAKQPWLNPPKGELGWRAQKGPIAENTSGFRATGFRVLLLAEAVEEKSAGGIIFVAKTIDKEKNAATICTVVEIGHDCWADKRADFCQVGDKVLVGQYVGKFQTSTKDGKEYRFVTDLDILSTVEE